MREYLNKISTQKPGNRKIAGKGYVILNGKYSREQYISDSTLKGHVTIVLEDGGIAENVPVVKHVWNDIVFPEEKNKLGSLIIWNDIGFVVVTGVIPKNDDVVNISENQFLISKKFVQIKKDGKTISNYIELRGDAKAGKLNVLVDGDEMAINVFNKSKSSKLNVNVKGDINLDSSGKINLNVAKKIGFSIDEKKTNFSYEKGVGFVYKDEFDNEFILNKDNAQLKAKKINLGNGKEPILLGKTTVDLLDEILKAIEAITTTTILGSMPILNIQSFIVAQAKLETLKSKLSSTD